jgi:hypothetical protein
MAACKKDAPPAGKNPKGVKTKPEAAAIAPPVAEAAPAKKKK